MSFIDFKLAVKLTPIQTVYQNVKFDWFGQTFQRGKQSIPLNFIFLLTGGTNLLIMWNRYCFNGDLKFNHVIGWSNYKLSKKLDVTCINKV